MNKKLRILLAEDDPNLGLLLQEYLTAKSYEVELAKDGNEGLDIFLSADKFDMCILDVMMPKKDGFSLAKEIRLKDALVPIIFLTAKSMKEDTIQGFKSGADDYMTKPFSMEELLMRMAAIFRRVNQDETEEQPTEFKIGEYTFDSSTQQLQLNGNCQKLTTKESELLKLFCQNLNKPVSRSLALKLIWGDDSYFNARSMDVYITKLRKHLKEDEHLQILNLHGEGFKLIHS
ncbi:response regulator transcription factor [Marinilongibacter aquaticus]|uniref:response regulator transcription factor n=1 Tax=Marinilongibacter aquaticus TaxID=2975157 RepID=UPI0021BD1434|nr:response regulator transcription factor [Marinilongibacter aquaticus]UBM57596.1 response regulator transcription factor [Marinilongibacter aquaticus]